MDAQSNLLNPPFEQSWYRGDLPHLQEPDGPYYHWFSQIVDGKPGHYKFTLRPSGSGGRCRVVSWGLETEWKTFDAGNKLIFDLHIEPDLLGEVLYIETIGS